VTLSQFPYARVSDDTRDVTDIIHPELREAMLLGVRALGLDIAGVDYITPDITRPPAEVGGGFCEINCTPMLQPHYATMPRDIASPIFNMLFAQGRPGHVPIVAICGDGRRQRVHKLLRQLLTEAGYTVGGATRDGLWAAGTRLNAENATGPMGARTLLQDPRIDAAILQTPIDVVVEHGLGIDACDVVVIQAAPTRDPNELPPTTVQALETLVNLAQRAVVIGVDHPLRDKLAQDHDASKFIVVSMRPNTPDVDVHISSDGAAIVFDGEANPPTFTLIEGSRAQRRIPCPELDPTDDNKARIRATAFAIGCALAMDISADTICRPAVEAL
jgi:cyanophycin synthetase